MADERASLRPTLGAGVVEYEADPGYRWPVDALVAERLEQWRDHKFGVIVHWGLYTALGEDGSWTLCRSRDEECMQIPSDFAGGDDAWQEHYVESRERFTGSAFDPDRWAAAIAGSGARYLVVTAKHHDGFSMFDTALSDYRSTSDEVPFGRDFVAELGDAVRERGLRLGIYFSKADWHHPGYWATDRPPVDRFRNHDDPERWAEFTTFTHGQVRELLTRYGDVDLLWLDAGWVKAPDEDLDIPSLAAAARTLQPGILVVDREVHSSVEDYRTPEQRVPDARLDYPWEACITLTDHWCTVPSPGPRKSVAEIVRLLVTVVARGGNLLLGVGPDAEGDLPADVAESLAGIGSWLDRFGHAVHATRAITPGTITGNGSAETFVDGYGRPWWLTQRAEEIHLIGLHQPDPARATLRVPLAREPAHVRVDGARLVGWRWRDARLEIRLRAIPVYAGQLPTTIVTVALSDEEAHGLPPRS